MDLLFFLNSLLLGAGLAMDAFSVSVANAMGEPEMRRYKQVATAGAFGIFQGMMPMLGWVCVHFLLRAFGILEGLIPWIALVLLLFIGGHMFCEGVRGSGGEAIRLTPKKLLIQAIATSIDALSVGFTIAAYGPAAAAVCSLIIALVTFIICMGGLLIGKRAGRALGGKAAIVGGVILVCIGVEIFVKGIMG